MRAARELAKNNTYEKVRAEIAFAGYDMRCGDSADTFLRVTNSLVSFREILRFCYAKSVFYRSDTKMGKMKCGKVTQVCRIWGKYSASSYLGIFSPRAF